MKINLLAQLRIRNFWFVSRYGLLPLFAVLLSSLSLQAQYSQTTSIVNISATTTNFTFFGTPATASGTATLTVNVRGDIDLTSEFFTISGETGGSLGTTNQGGQCNTAFTTTTFSIPAASINSWASNGSITITAVASAAVNFATLCSNDAIQMTLSYNTGPSCTVNAGSNQSICVGGSAQLSASGSPSGGNYSWSPTTGLNNPNIANPTASPSSSTNYTVTYTQGGPSYSENFQSGAPGWTTGTQNGNNNWQLGSVAGNGVNLGSTAFGTPNSGSPLGFEQSFLISPVLNLSGGTRTVSFDTWSCNENPPWDLEELQISYNGGLTWQTLIPNSSLIWTTQSSWNTNSVTITNGTATTRFRFFYNTVDGCCGCTGGWWIDNFIVSGGVACTATDQVTVTVVPDPTVSISGGGTVCVGGNRTLSASSSNGLLCSYQWQVSTNGGASYSNISGATGSTYNTGALTATRVYRVRRICSGSGCGDPFSNSQTVTVVADPSVSISGGGTVCSGGNRTLSASTSGGVSCSYQWQVSTNGGSTFSNIGGATGSTYNTGALTATRVYRVRRNCTGSGCSDPFSNNQTVTVVADPSVSITGAATICSGGSRTLTASTSGGTGSCSLQWQISTNGGSTFSNISGATGSTYNTGSLTATRVYRVVRTCNGSGCNTATSNNQTITVLSDPSVSITGGGTVCSGGNRTLSASTSGGVSCSYQWQVSTNGGSTYSNISGATGSTYNTGSLTASRVYRVQRICNGTGCGDPFSNSQTVTVVADPSVSISGAATICTGGSRTLTATTSGGTGSCSLQWQVSTNGGSTFSNISGATSSTYNTGVLTATRVYRVVRNCNGSGCNTATSNNQTITVLSDPSVSISGGGTICSGGSRTLSASTSGGVSCSYQWQISTNGGSTFSNIGGATGSTYNTGALTATRVYRVQRICTGTGCSDPISNNQTVTVVADPSISVSGGGQICPGGTRTLTASSSGGTGTCTIQWQRSSSSSGPWTNVGSNSSTYNTGAISSDFFYRAVRNCTGTGCNQAISGVVQVFLDNTPPNAICNNLTVNLNASGNASIGASQINNGSTDNCGITNLSVSPSSFNCTDLGNNAVTLTVTDAEGNSDNCSATVLVRDVTNPNVTCQNFTANIGTALTSTVTVNNVTSTLSDNCTIATSTVSPNSFDCNDVGGTFTVTVNATDQSGNTNSCTAQVTVADPNSNCNQPPAAVCQNVTVNANGSCQAVVAPSALDGGSTDPDNDPLTFTANPGSPYPLGVTNVVLTVSDPDGASDQCNATVTVVDNTAPNAVCQNVTVALNGSGNASVAASQVNNGSSDNCGIASISVSPSSFSCSNLGNNTVTLTVTDNAGNSDNCTATVTVQDVTPPNAVCQNTTVQLNAAGNGSITASDVNNGSSDNCTISSINLSQSSFGCTDVGSNSITVTVTDQSGNSATCAPTVTVVDNIAPNAVCQNVTIQLNASGNASTSAGAVNNGSSDNCSISSQTLSQTNFGCNDTGNNNVTLTVTDPSGNSDNCAATITVLDNIDPTAICQNVTLQLNGSGNATLAASSVNNGSNDNCSIASTSVSPSSFDCSDLGSNTVTLTVTDPSGNSDNCTANATVLDNIAPNAVCQSITVQLDASGNVSIAATDIDNGSTDNCTIASRTVSPSTFDCGDVGANTVTLTVQDQSGNSDNCTATVTVQDNVAPVAICQNVTVQLNASGAGSTTAAAVNNGSNDACGIAGLSLNTTNFGCTDVGNNSVTLTVTDNNGNTSTCSANVAVEDNIDPVAVCQNITIQLNASGTVSIAATDIDNGSSDACGIATRSLDVTSFSCSTVGNNNVNLTVTDVNGNNSTCGAIVTVEDNIAPVAICQDITVQLNASGNASIAGSDVDNGSTDACGISNLSVTPNAFTCSNVGNNTVTLTATDNNGNSSTCNAVVTVEDNVAPNAICRDLTLQLDGSGNASTTAAAVNNNSSDACGIANLSIDNSTFNCANFNVTNTVTLTVTDVNGNASTCTSNITINDPIDPVANCQDITVQLDQNGAVTVNPQLVDNGSTDNCAVTNFILDNANYGCANVNTVNNVVLTVFDAANNTNTCSAVITVEDNVAPNAICQDLTVQIGATGTAVINAGLVDSGSNDACGIASLVLTGGNYTCSDIGSTSETLTVTDVNGNVSTCTSQITIEDNISPSALCQDVTVQLDAGGNAFVTTGDVDNGSSDNCGLGVLVLSQDQFNCSDVGTNSVVLIVNDVNGNSGICFADITVEDNLAPNAVCQDVTVSLNASGNGSITTSDVNNGSNDNCGIASLSLNNTSFDCSNINTTNTVTLSVTDVNGNSSNCSSNVTVVDNVAPVALCQNVTVQLDANGAGSTSASAINNGSTDACGIASLTLDNSNFGCADVGFNTVTLTVTDVNGNASTCSGNVTVQDNVAPNAVCQNITVQLNGSGNASITTGDVDNGSSDACGIANLALDNTNFNCASVAANNVVTLTVTDVNGNVSTCTSTVSIEDNVAPNALCQDLTIQLDANGAGSITTANVNNGSSDNCAIANLSLDNSSFGCNDVGSGNTVTLTVTDVNSNQSSCTATITVEDNIAPIAVCQDVTVQLDVNGAGSITTTDVDNGSNDACGIANLSLDNTSFACGNVGINNTVILTVTDNNSNSSTCSANVTVEDNVAPNAVCQDITVQLDPTGNATITPADINNGSSDACGIAGLSLDNTIFNCANVAGNTVTLTVTDVNGNSSTCTANVSIEDNVAPIALCQNVTVQLDANGNGGITTGDIDNGSSDNCAIASLSLDNSSFDCNNVGSNTVTLTVTDVNSNASTCTGIVTVEDNVDPIALCQDVTVQLDANGAGSTTAGAVDNGSNDACGIANLSLDVANFGCTNVGPNTVTLTATDVNGNSSTCTGIVTIEDNVAPVALCQDVTVQLNAGGTGSTNANAINNGSNDACGIASLSLDVSSFDCNNVGSNTVTLTATDNNGNSSTCTANVEVEDNVAPIALCQDITVQLGANGAGSTTAGDVDNGSNDACGIATLSLSNTSFVCSDVGPNNVILVVTDNNGNQNTCSAIVTVEDNVAPVALCQDVTVQLDANGAGSITTVDVNNGSNDACGIASVSLDNTSFACSNVGGNTVTLTVTDVNSNSSTCTATITVEDNIAPIALCQDLTVQLDVNGAGSITAAGVDNGSNDACGIASLSLDNTSFACADVGANTVTLTATDVNNNSTTCTAQITVEDNVAPVAICQDITVQLDPTGNATITPQDVDNGSNDACGIASLSLDNTTFNCANVAGNTVTLTVTDNNGNISTCTANVNIEDNVAPIALCQDVTVQLDANGAGSITTQDVDNGSNDNCAVANLALDNTTFGCNNVGNGNTVTLTVTDVNNNQSSCTATITVEDNIAPIALCQDVTVQLDANGAGSITANDIDNGSNDACGIASLSVTPNSFACSNVGGNTVTLTATDVNGNSTSCTANVQVEDNVAPIALCQDVTVQLDANGAGSITTGDVDNGSNDACGIASLSLDNSNFACADVGANTVTLTVTDNNSNVSTCTSIITVEDNVAPIAICQDITVQLDGTGNATITPQDIDNGSNDACGIASLSLDNTVFNCNNVAGNQVTLTVTDVNGNQSTCTANVTIEDNVPPVAVCQDITIQLDAQGAASITPQDVDNGSTDNCAIAGLSLDNTSFACSNVGGNTVTLTVTDVNGNSSTCTSIITVEDNVAPIALCQDVTVQLDANGAGSITTGDVDNGSNDACGIASLSLDNSNFACADVGANTVTLTVTDVNGNQSSCTSTITVEDNIAPIALCQDHTVQLDGQGAGSITPQDVDNGSNDACGIASLSLDITSFGCSNVGSNPVVLTVTDVNNNSATCGANITVEDTVSPIALCQDVTIQLDANGAGSTTAQDVDNGSNDACGIANLQLDNTSFDCNNVGSGNTVTLTVTDVNNNQSSCTATVTVEDNVDPIALCQDITIQLDANGASSITAQDVDNGSNDACGIASLSVSPDNFDCANTGSNTVTLTVTDNNNNVSTCNAIVTVQDTISPVIVCASDLTVSCNAEIPPVDVNSVTVTDNCPGAFPTHISDTDNGGLGCLSSPRTIDRLYQATDASGNTSTCNQLITVIDTIAPVITCPPAVTINCTDPTDPASTGLATATDNCIPGGGGSPAIMYQLADSLGNTDINYCGLFPCFFQDPWGEASLFGTGTTFSMNVSMEQFWFIESVAFKVGNSSSDFTLDQNGLPVQDASWTVVNTPAPTANFSQPIVLPDTSCKVIAMRVFIIRQEVFTGLDLSSRRSVYLLDSSFATSANPTTSEYLQGWCPAGSPLPGGPDITFNDVSVPGCGNTQTITRTFTATDTCGNNTSCTQVITTQDVFPPVITCPADITVNNDLGICGAAVSYTPTATDECGTTQVATNIASGSIFQAGTTTVTAAANDECGNISICSFDVTVLDAEAPNAVCQDITVQLDPTGNATITAADVDGGSTDNCVIDTIFANPTTFNCANVAGNTVTLTVIDTAGNQSTCTANVTIEDNVPPIAVCQDITIQLDAQGAASIVPADVDGGSNDNCAVDSLSLDNDSFGCVDVGSNTVTLTVYDVNGNTSTCTANVEVEDNVNPIALCQDVTVQLDANGQGSTTPQDVDNGSNDACGIASLSLDNTNFDCNNVGSGNTVTLTATDVNGNSSTCTATVTVEDNINPIALCQDVTVQLDANGAGSTTPQDVDNGSNDACGIASLSLDNSNFDCSNVGSGNTVTLTATDVNGNSSTCTAIVTVEDNVNPIALCQDVTVQLDANGQGSTTPQDVDNGSNDACGIASLSLDNTNFDCNNVGSGNTVTLTATDVNGNSSTCTAIVTVEDNVNPIALCQDVTVQLDANGQGSTTPQDVDNGSNDACGIASLSLDNSNFDCNNVGNGNTVTLTATDVNGNSSTCTAIVTVEDNINPIALCQDVTVQLDANGQGSTTPQDVDNGSNDACGIASLSLDNTNFDCNNVGSGNTVTLTATDVNGNSSTCTATVTVEDNIAPIAICQNITVQLDSTGIVNIVPEDVDNGSSDACGIANLSLDITSFNCSNVNGNTVTLTVTDVNGNASTCTAQVTVNDTVPPVTVCRNITVQLDSNGLADIVPADVDGGSTSNCGIAGLSLDLSSFDCSSVGPNTVILTATDVNNNASSCTALVEVEDNLAPTAICQNITVQLDVNGQAIITPQDIDNGSNDECGIASLSINVSSFGCPIGGANIVTLTVVDVNGNLSTCSSAITVEDNVNPEVICRDITVQLDANGQASILPSDVDNGTSDACGIASLTVGPNTFNCQNVGPNTVTLTATDFNNNTDSCTANVEIQDNVAPNAICQDITIQLDANGQASITPGDVDGGSNDACGIASLVVSPNTFDCNDVNNASNIVTLTVTDVNGNVSTCTSDITVEDNIAPTAICQSITVQLDSSGMASISGTDIDNGSFDNCGVANLSVTPNQFECQNVGDNTVVLTVTDVNGNSSTCTANVNVQDNIAPTAICNDVTISIDETGIATLSVVDVDGGSFDNCDVLSVVIDTDTFTCEDLNSNTVTLTITDVNGNSSSCTSNITVVDPVPPVAVCQDITIYLDNGGNASITGADIDGGSSDNCSIVSLVANPNSFACDDVGANPVVLTVTDQSGNDSTCTAQVTVVDSVSPVALCQDVTVQLDVNGQGGITAQDIDNGSSDACGIASLSVSPSSFDCSNVGNNTVTLTVTDVNGNVSTCNANVAVEDNVAPVALCQDVTVQLDVNGQGGITAQDIDNGSNDACGIASLSVSPSSFDCSNVGNNTVTLTVTDNNGNVSTCTANVSVQDTVDPVALCQDVTVQLDVNGQGGITPQDIDNGSNDACGIASLSVSPNTFSCSNVGNNTVTLTVTDNNGNVSTCTANVSVEDNIAPNAVCQDITVQLDANGNASITASDVDGGSNDNCGIASLSVSVTSFDCSDLGSNGVTLTVTDVNGNVSTCAANVEVEDNIAPMITCPGDLTFECSDNLPVVSANDASASDNCTVVSLVVVSVDNGGSGCNGDSLIITNTYTATDQSGNSTSCDQIFTVESTPIVTTTSPNAFVFPAYPDSACATIGVTVTGGCPGYTYLWSNGATTPSQTVCPTQSTVYTVTVTDRLGCTTTDSVKVCAIDITCTQGNGNGNGPIRVQFCHIPNGNPNNAMTMCLPINAVQAHLAQGHGGDHLGPCGSIASRDCDFDGNNRQASASSSPEAGSSPEAPSGSTLEAFPNPFTSEVNIRFAIGMDDFATIKVFDLRGVEVATIFEGHVLGGETTEVEFRPENLAKGIYYARLTTEAGETMVQKLIFK